MAVAHTWDLDVLKPGEFEVDVVGRSISGGSSEPGRISHATDYAFGGLVQVRYGAVDIDSRAQNLYWNRLAARLNGAVRPVRIPIITDRIQPDAITATLDGAHAAEATEISIDVSSGAAVRAGMWLGIDHADAGPRVYGIEAIISTTDQGGGAVDYTVTIDPPLRDAASDGAALSFDRPACLMTLAPRQSMAWAVEPVWRSRPSVTFIEAEF